MTYTEAVMTNMDVANRMNELFKENKWQQVQEELFAEDAVSIESDHFQGTKTVKGLAAIMQKGKEFNEMLEEMHSCWHSEPIVAGNFISFSMGMEVTMKGKGRITKWAIEKLNELGFEWNVGSPDWDERFEEAKKFYEKNGFSNIKVTDNQSIAYWCYRQKRDKQSLSDEQIDRRVYLYLQ